MDSSVLSRRNYLKKPWLLIDVPLLKQQIRPIVMLFFSSLCIAMCFPYTLSYVSIGCKGSIDLNEGISTD